MAFPRNFRVRNPDRDRDTDLQRFDRLTRLVAELRDQAAKELDGLTRRYEEVGTTAAFAQQAEDYEGTTPGSERRIGLLTQEVMHCSARMENLRRQIAYFEKIEGEISAAGAQLTAPPDTGRDSARADRR